MTVDLNAVGVNMSIWDGLIRKGMTDAIMGLSKLMERNIKVESIKIVKVPVKDVTEMLGGPDTMIVGIYLSFTGAAEGHLMLAHHPDVAYALSGMLVGDLTGRKKDSLSDMELSALGEVGNITGSLFLNAIANALGVTLCPSPPVVLVDMAGAIMDIALSEILMESDDVFVVETEFTTDDKTVVGKFMMMPNKSFRDLPGKILGV